MTTTVTVTTHDWPVAVARLNPETGEKAVGEERVEPHSQAMFYIHQTQQLTLRELPLPEKVLTDG